jgi:hypothetical protein
MDAEHVERVVILEHRLQRHDRPQADDAGNGTEHDRTHRTGKAGRRGDRDEAGHRTRCRAEQAGMATGELLSDGPGDGRSGRSGDGVEHGLCGKAGGLEVGAGVEAEPADPQQAGADEGEGEVVRRDRLLEELLARPEDDRGDETGHTGIDVHHSAAGEVIGAEAERKPPRTTPCGRSAGRRR